MPDDPCSTIVQALSGRWYTLGLTFESREALRAALAPHHTLDDVRRVRERCRRGDSSVRVRDLRLLMYAMLFAHHAEEIGPSWERRTDVVDDVLQFVRSVPNKLESIVASGVIH